MQLNREVELQIQALNDSVSYIHEHHVVMLKNFLRRNKVQEESDFDGQAFAKSSIRSAPELDIIKQTVEIQHHLFGLSNFFHTLPAALDYAQFKDDFLEVSNRFLEAVNNPFMRGAECPPSQAVPILGNEFYTAAQNVRSSQALVFRQLNVQAMWKRDVVCVHPRHKLCSRHLQTAVQGAGETGIALMDHDYAWALI